MEWILSTISRQSTGKPVEIVSKTLKLHLIMLSYILAIWANWAPRKTLTASWSTPNKNKGKCVKVGITCVKVLPLEVLLTGLTVSLVKLLEITSTSAVTCPAVELKRIMKTQRTILVGRSASYPTTINLLLPVDLGIILTLAQLRTTAERFN